MIDSHAHLISQDAAALERAAAAGVTAIVNIATDEASLLHGLELQKNVSAPRIYLTASTTPHDVEKDGEYFFPIVEKAAREGKLQAIGETGLDYYYEHAPRELQAVYLRKYLRLAKSVDLPVVIHCRDAFADFYRIYVEEGSPPAILHCFTGTMKEAEEGLRLGFYISFSGIVTFPKSHELREVATMVPLDRMLIETDSPYLAPGKHRGKQNEPGFIRVTAEVVAGLKGVDAAELIAQTAHNTRTIFRLS